MFAGERQVVVQPSGEKNLVDRQPAVAEGGGAGAQVYSPHPDEGLTVFLLDGFCDSATVRQVRQGTVLSCRKFYFML